MQLKICALVLVQPYSFSHSFPMCFKRFGSSKFFSNCWFWLEILEIYGYWILLRKHALLIFLKHLFFICKDFQFKKVLELVGFLSTIFSILFPVVINKTSKNGNFSPFMFIRKLDIFVNSLIFSAHIHF